MPATNGKRYYAICQQIGRDIVPYLCHVPVENSDRDYVDVINVTIQISCLFKVRQVCTLGGTAKVAVALWVVAILCSIPFPVITFLEQTMFYDGSIVDVCRTHIRFPWDIYIIITIVIFFAIPLIVLVAVYGLICHKLIIQSREEEISANPRSSSTLKSRRQVVIMLVIVATLFFVCLLPIKVVSLWLIYALPSDIEKLGLEGYLTLMSFARIMLYINSSVNPIIYNLVSTRFRKYFRRSIICLNRGRRSAQYWSEHSSDFNASSKRTLTTCTSYSYVENTETVAMPLGKVGDSNHADV